MLWFGDRFSHDLVGESSGPAHFSIAFMELNLLLYHSEGLEGV
jgi:hypothetical protein